MEQATSTTLENRADSYEEGNDRNAISGGNDSVGSTTSSNDNSNKDDKLIDSAGINESYDNVLKDCESEGMHLLPQVVSPVDNTTENVTVEKLLIRTRERDKALKDTFHYRTLVEKLETDVRKLKTTLHHRVATVCDFWRNSVLEGRSRSGAILKQALTQRKD